MSDLVLYVVLGHWPVVELDQVHERAVRALHVPGQVQQRLREAAEGE